MDEVQKPRNSFPQFCLFLFTRGPLSGRPVSLYYDHFLPRPVYSSTLKIVTTRSPETLMEVDRSYGVTFQKIIPFVFSKIHIMRHPTFRRWHVTGVTLTKLDHYTMFQK
jgi:hypothetical protein